MSAPESSNSKAPPSLLPSADKNAQPGGSRILANLEGRVDASAASDKSSRSRAPWLLVALLVVAAGGFGAWQVRQHHAVAVTEAGSGSNAVQAAAKPAAASNAAVAVAAAASAASAVQPQPATIVADDSDDKAAANASASASGPAVASSSDAKGDNDNSRLSRALADGAKDASAPAAGTVASHASHEASKQEVAAARGKHETREAMREAHENAKKRTVVAQSKKPADAKAGQGKDSDVDLLAALVAHTEPYKSGEKPAATATKVSTPASGSLAEQVKACGQRGFFSDQLCLWRVCDGHWGKDPACPNSSATQARQP